MLIKYFHFIHLILINHFLIIINLNVNKIKKPQGEIIGINKFSTKTTNKIFNFMDQFFNGKNKSLSWESFIDYYFYYAV